MHLLRKVQNKIMYRRNIIVGKQLTISLECSNEMVSCLPAMIFLQVFYFPKLENIMCRYEVLFLRFVSKADFSRFVRFYLSTKSTKHKKSNFLIERNNST